MALDLTQLLEQAASVPWPPRDPVTEPPTSLRAAIGQDPIQLGRIEFLILLFLASKPYHAFTRRAIADAIRLAEEATAAEPTQLGPDDIDDYIQSLRDQLGVLHDYVQSVPYVGYRFKP